MEKEFITTLSHSPEDEEPWLWWFHVPVEGTHIKSVTSVRRAKCEVSDKAVESHYVNFLLTDNFSAEFWPQTGESWGNSSFLQSWEMYWPTRHAKYTKHWVFLGLLCLIKRQRLVPQKLLPPLFYHAGSVVPFYTLSLLTGTGLSEDSLLASPITFFGILLQYLFSNLRDSEVYICPGQG